MSISLRVDGRPGPCRRTARQLTRASEAVADAADFLFRERHRSVDGLDGGAGLAYRTRVTGSANDAEMLSRCVARLGRGLVELADAIEDVRDRMDRARDLVAPYDLVHGTRLEEPVDRDGDDPRLVQARRLAHRDAADLVRQARKDEKEAHDDWRATLASYAIDLGQDTIPGLPAGSLLPPVPGIPEAPRRHDRPERPEPPRHHRPGEQRAEPDPTAVPGGGADSPRAHPVPQLPGHGSRMPADVTPAGAGLGGAALAAAPVLIGTVLDVPVLAGPVLAGHLLGGEPRAVLGSDDPLAPLPTTSSLPDPQGTEPGGPAHLEVFDVPCHPDS